MPQNAATQRRYSGINVLILWGAVIERGFAGQSWLTFRQALGLGGNVRKGERGTTVVYADRFTPDDERRRAERDGDDPYVIPFLKRFTVFNTDQCENLPEELTTAPAPVPEGLILPDAEALIAATYAPVAEALRALRDAGAAHAMLSGSGGATFALCEREAQARALAAAIVPPAGAQLFVVPLASAGWRS